MKDVLMKKLIKKEEKRKRNVVNLIASENHTYKEVRQALGSVLTDKYSEGRPGNRYYTGNENIDQIELLAEKRALELFKLNPEDWKVNVQTIKEDRTLVQLKRYKNRINSLFYVSQ